MIKGTKFNKVLHIGRVQLGYFKRHVFIKVEIREDGELSITGVIGPTQYGNCAGGCGQIDMEFEHRNKNDNDCRYGDRNIKARDIEYAPGWNRQEWFNLLDIWQRWHLNGMNPGCEHQRAWDARKKCVIVTYRLTGDISKEQSRIKEAAMKGLENIGQVKLTEHDQRIVALPWELKRPAEQSLTGDLAKHYKESSRETKTAGWLHPEEHPDGLLTKPCPECGYKYGTAWNKEALPDSVIAYLESLPETDITPP